MAKLPIDSASPEELDQEKLDAEELAAGAEPEPEEPEPVEPGEDEPKREVDKFIADPILLRQAQLDRYKAGRVAINTALSELGLTSEQASQIDQAGGLGNIDPKLLDKYLTPDQLKIANKVLAVIHKTPKAADENPPDEPKTYKALSRIWMPLILDQVGKTAWTVEEVLKAMMPLINKWANEYGRHRPGYQPDEGISDGTKAVLQALEKDGGRAPFAYFCANQIKRAIQRGEKASSIIPIPHRERLYSDKAVTSMDAAADDAESQQSLSGAIPADQQTVTKKPCPACGQGDIPKGMIKDADTGEVVRCPVCKGTKYVLVGGYRTETGDPEEKAATRQKVSDLKAQLGRIVHVANLSQRQIETILLKFGLGSLYDPSIRDADVENLPSGIMENTAISRIMAYADTILYRPYVQTSKEGQPIGASKPTGIWVEAESRGKTELFQQIWSKAFQVGSVKWYKVAKPWGKYKGGEVIDVPESEAQSLLDAGYIQPGPQDVDEESPETPPFDPELPVALQIAPLYGKHPEITPLQGETKGKTSEKDALELMVSEMQAKIAPNVKIATKSKQFAKQQYDSAMDKINRLTKVDYRCQNCNRRWIGDARTPETQCANCGSEKISLADPKSARATLDAVRLLNSHKEMKECVDALLQLKYLTLLDEVAAGTATIEDIQQIGYI